MKRRKRRRRREGKKGNTVCVCAYALVLGIHRYINTHHLYTLLSLLLLLLIWMMCVCMYVQTGRGHLFYDATCYLLCTHTHTKIAARSIISRDRLPWIGACWSSRVSAKHRHRKESERRYSISQLRLNMASSPALSVSFLLLRLRLRLFSFRRLHRRRQCPPDRFISFSF